MFCYHFGHETLLTSQISAITLNLWIKLFAMYRINKAFYLFINFSLFLWVFNVIKVSVLTALPSNTLCSKNKRGSGNKRKSPPYWRIFQTLSWGLWRVHRMQECSEVVLTGVDINAHMVYVNSKVQYNRLRNEKRLSHWEIIVLY